MNNPKMKNRNPQARGSNKGNNILKGDCKALLEGSKAWALYSFQYDKQEYIFPFFLCAAHLFTKS